jgi:hypothetical protein
VEVTRPLRRRLLFYSSIYFVWILLIFYASGGAHGQFSSWFAGWQQWDARWYEHIWREGYPQADPRTLVFPPGYPFIVGSFSKLFSGSFLGTAVVLNLGAFFLSAVLISEWFARKFGVSAAPIFVFALSAPAAYFNFTAYSDVLFMLLLWVLLWLALAAPKPQSLRVRVAECLLLLALPWIRLTGYALASWLFARRVVALAVLGSLALWLGFNRAIAGRAFYFLRAQELFGMPRGNFFQGFADSFLHLASDRSHPMNWLEFGFLPLFYLGALIAAGAWLAKKREGLLALTVFSILLLSYNQGFWRSVVRYDLPLTPVLCLPLLVNAPPQPRIVASLCRAAFYALTFAQFVLQIYFARAFHVGAWAF